MSLRRKRLQSPRLARRCRFRRPGMIDGRISSVRVFCCAFELVTKLREMKKAATALDSVIDAEKELFKRTPELIEEVHLPPQSIAGIRVKGKYSHSGKVFGRLRRMLGGIISRKPLTLHYDKEYSE